MNDQYGQYGQYGPPQGRPPQPHTMPPQYGPPPGQPFHGRQTQQMPGPYSYHQPAPPMPAPRNGLGLAALICGGIGCLFGFVAIGFVIAGPLAIVAIALGITGMSRARKGVATNGGVATIGMILGIFAATASIWGAQHVFTAVNDTQRRIDCIASADTEDEMLACAK
ncbi:DUF4190 domain-containing protein [Streptosporangium carneum]|uniref:DUF4190 domain-containing protein n=1 Tax=Streptosporangium carneum TaxID=47481 RepID=A0A9W6MC64_9ACTN|nr:DUF4190 domain-containing protein [Streptosporangium carneum]GLK08757.1 hypothetical protein GCM10017600_21620 [Streptosporangium carneum]